MEYGNSKIVMTYNYMKEELKKLAPLFLQIMGKLIFNYFFCVTIIFSVDNNNI